MYEEHGLMSDGELGKKGRERTKRFDKFEMGIKALCRYKPRMSGDIGSWIGQI